MSSPDTTNQFFELAVQFVNQTNRHVFLTGKAGTGKTTFLRYIQEHSAKKMAVAAPTGVAAINAGGVTLHSLFQLPFGAFVPNVQSGWNSNSTINNPHTLFKNLRLSKDKRELIRELDLLVIDEVSMLRADLLDAIDLIIRHIRRQPNKPFGGVQLLFIGDLYQLPPVINNEEWEVLKEYYKSPFFFDALVLKQAPPLYLELKKIYRQHELDFIRILNNIRNNQVTTEDLDRLHQHYRPGFEVPENDHYITLTTHNAKADTINQNQLNKLAGRLYEFEAEIQRDFNEKAFPADKVLQLKAGAQIMFIKNDKGESRRYYNGKIATVSRIEKDRIFTRFPGEEQELELEKETWKNIRYQYNKEADQVEEEELGAFIQYPIRLAWAITIHKSQGLTFTKAIVDAGAAFAPGQVYVALSRLTSLQGLVLFSRIQPHCIQTNEQVQAFTRLEMPEQALQEQLEQGQKTFIIRSLQQCFDWNKLVAGFSDHYEGYETLEIPDKNNAIEWAKALLDTVTQQQEVAQKFTRQLDQLLPDESQQGQAILRERVAAACQYFLKLLATCMDTLKGQIEAVKIKPRTRKYVSQLDELFLLPQRKTKELQQALVITEALSRNMNPGALLQLVEEKKTAVTQAIPATAEKKARAPKGESQRISLQFFKEGQTVADIAAKRGMALSTIEGHLAGFISTGEIKLHELVEESKSAAILQVIEQMPGNTLFGPIREKLGDAYSYLEIKAVLQHLQWMNKLTGAAAMGA